LTADVWSILNLSATRLRQPYEIPLFGNLIMKSLAIDFSFPFLMPMFSAMKLVPVK
jgi:hypothetical protein